MIQTPSTSISRFPRSAPGVILNWLEMTYLCGFYVLVPITMLFPAFTGGSEAWAFFPLMLTSVYCAIGLVWAYIRLGYLYLMS